METFYVTKYALSSGIEKQECERTPNGYLRPAKGWGLFTLNRDAFETEAEAIADAETRRIKKIASLKKQLAKLEALSFSVAQGEG